MPTKYKYNVQAFTKNDAISYYLLGAFITDGSVRKNLSRCSISSKDDDWLRSINKIISNDNLIKYHNKKLSLCQILTINNKQICQWLISNNCIPNKTLKADLPKIPEKYFRDFIRGCMDGDGSIGLYTMKNGRTELSCYLCGASKKFMIHLSKKLENMKFRFSLTTVHPSKIKPSIINGKLIIAKNTMYRIKFSAREALKFLKWIYYENKLICLNRKLQIANNGFKYYSELDGRKTSKFRGVCWSKISNKWRASLTLNYKQIHIGLYKNEIEAAKAYDKKSIELFNDKSLLNFS